MIKVGMIIADRYEIIEKIGTGGMSDVYRAMDHKLNRYVAVKVLKQEFSENTDFVSKFRVEAQAAAGLMHPNIVNVYDVGEESASHYIVMELVEGITLKKYIEKKARLSIKEAVSIAIQVSMGIEAAHNNHIIHRDIKPQNIIISKEGKVKVTDFGIAKAATSNTITSNVMGSVHYTSPEQVRGGFSDEKSDIYSLGITLFEMLTGRVPFNGETTVAVAIKHIQEPMPSPRDFVTEIPISVEQIVMKCTQKSPDRRYQNAPELVEDLKKSLISPDENFVKIEDEEVSGATKNITKKEMEEIKRQSYQSMDEKLHRTGNVPRPIDVINEENKKNNSDDFDEQYEEYSEEGYEGGYEEYPEDYQDEYLDEDEYYEEDGFAYEDEEEINPSAGKNKKDENGKTKTGNKTSSKSRNKSGSKSSSKSGSKSGSKTGSKSSGKAGNKSANKTGNKNTSSSKKGSRKRPEDDYDPKMEMITNILIVVAAVVIGFIFLFVIAKTAGFDFSGNSSSNIGNSNNNPNAGVTSEIMMPTVVGQDAKTATDALSAAGFIPVINYEESETVAANIIISASIAPGTMVASGSEVLIVVSSGVDGIPVPYVEGLSKAEATAKLEGEGFVVRVTKVSSETVEKDYVISQNPTSDSKISRGGVVELLVSSGVEMVPVEVPSVLNMDEATAILTLAEHGLTGVMVAEEYSDTVEAGLVTYQNYQAGLTVNSGTEVEFRISAGPEPAYYKCQTDVSAPADYAGGDATVVLYGSDGSQLFSTVTSAFPVAINVDNIWMINSGSISITYNINKQQEVTDEAGNVTVQTYQEQTTAQPIAVNFTKVVQ